MSTHANDGAPGTVLVTGGTGTLGRLVVPRLRDAGATVRVLTRQELPPGNGVEYVTGDLATGEGVGAAVAGARTVLHAAGSSKGDREKTETLVRALTGTEVRHLVYISVVGADRVPVHSGLDRAMFGYVESKLASEKVVEESGVPWTILRASQFHDLILTMAKAMAKMPVVPVPKGMRAQPVEADEVAARLVELTLGPPAGLVPDIAGPRAYEMRELIRDYLDAAGKHRALMPVRLPGGAARAFREGANLAPDRAVGTRTWEDFLAANVA